MKNSSRLKYLYLRTLAKFQTSLNTAFKGQELEAYRGDAAQFEKVHCLLPFESTLLRGYLIEPLEVKGIIVGVLEECVPLH